MNHLCVTLVPLFYDLSKEEQIEINKLATHHTYKKNDIIFQPGDDKLVIVARGRMKVYQLSSNGKEQLFRIVELGDYEGENQLFGIKNEELFGQALEKTEICSLSKTAFNQVLLTNPRIALKLFEFSAKKMAKMERQVQLLSMERIEDRLAAYLLDLLEGREKNELDLPITMKDIALYLGTTPETLSRKFKYLENEGYIQRIGKKIIIEDKDKLLDL
ncbi:Crp/Fnr family transcriptional regulator [Staphylococcus sp. 17KM0847]|uniref:Crp/Fnr family transcriptional regulator n=1 Tax=Staphylococcus sp. 17KM0847 TaxID=2583989 RepID=UPI0015DD25C1|nr:Crp/Fnr family transcriptional regulator [Staphylococcus sp. 17KM0847]QLK86400.1 Crp/Fnr family transcriptional regulator [Staphylococcus sp. 17KM0847]